MSNNRNAAIPRFLAGLLLLSVFFGQPPLLAAPADSCSTRTITLSATDKSDPKLWKIKTDLQPADLIIHAGGQLATIVSLKPTTPLNRVIMLIDTSGSMGYESDKKRVSAKWRIIESAADEFANRLPSTHAAGLVLFSTDIEQRVRLGEDRSVLLKQIQALSQVRPFGHTRLWDALIESVQMFGNAQPGDAILIASDGGDNESRNSSAKAKKLLLDSGVRVFVVLLPDEFGRTPEEQSGYQDLLQLARDTGGSSFTVVTKDTYQEMKEVSATNAVRFLLGHATFFYSAELQFPKPLPGTPHITASVSNRKARELIELLVPEKLPPCRLQP